jgi:hypothetical protein
VARCHRTRDGEVGDAGLDHDLAVVEIDLQDPPQASQHDQDALLDR